MAKKKVFQISDALADGLEQTITAAHNYSGELRIDVIPIKKIETDPDNPRDLKLDFNDIYQGILESDENFTRKTEELANLQTLANSIRSQGIINPIVVYKYGEKYRIVAGERRTLASILAGKSEIQAKILDNKPNDLKISLLSNILRLTWQFNPAPPAMHKLLLLVTLCNLSARYNTPLSNSS